MKIISKAGGCSGAISETGWEAADVAVSSMTELVHWGDRPAAERVVASARSPLRFAAQCCTFFRISSRAAANLSESGRHAIFELSYKAHKKSIGFLFVRFLFVRRVLTKDRTFFKLDCDRRRVVVSRLTRSAKSTRLAVLLRRVKRVHAVLHHRSSWRVPLVLIVVRQAGRIVRAPGERWSGKKVPSFCASRTIDIGSFVPRITRVATESQLEFLPWSPVHASLSAVVIFHQLGHFII